MHKNERVVYFSDLVIYSRSFKERDRGLSPKPLREILSYIKHLCDNDLDAAKFDNENQIYYISDLKLTANNSKAVLLINRSNKNAADPIFSNPDEGSRRVVNKKTGEGSDSSSHVIISLDHKRGFPNRHVMIFELATGIGAGALEKYLNNLMKKAGKEFHDQYLVPALSGEVDDQGNVKMFKYYTHLEILGHVSGEFEQELNGGVIEELELFTEIGYQNNWDDGGFAKEKRKSVHISVSKFPLIGNWAVLAGALRMGFNSRFEKARIHFKTRENSNREVEMETETMQLAQEYHYIKRETISGFNPHLLASYDKIYQPIMNKMLSIFPEG